MVVGAGVAGEAGSEVDIEGDSSEDSDKRLDAGRSISFIRINVATLWVMINVESPQTQIIDE